MRLNGGGPTFTTCVQDRIFAYPVIAVLIFDVLVPMIVVLITVRSLSMASVFADTARIFFSTSFIDD